MVHERYVYVCIVLTLISVIIIIYNYPYVSCVHCVCMLYYIQIHLIMKSFIVKEMGVKPEQKRSLSHNASSATLPTAPLR